MTLWATNSFLEIIVAMKIFRRKRSKSISKGSPNAVPPPEVITNSALTAGGPPSRSASMQNIAMGRSRSSESLSSVASVDLKANATGTLETFARINTARRRGGHSEKIVMVPYFGHFAGQRLVFDLKRHTDFTVNIKVKNESQVLASLCHRQRQKETVRDQCIKFAHEVTTQTPHQQPPSLSFLCEQTIILNMGEIPYWMLPPRYSAQFNSIECQPILVHVCPSHLSPSPLMMKIKKNLSIRELQWMLSKKLCIDNPLAVTLYLKDSLETLPTLSSIPSALTELICIIAPSAQQQVNRHTSTDKITRQSCDSLSVCVSLIGKGVKEIQVKPSTQLYQFEALIKHDFGLCLDSFLYLPDVFSKHGRSYSPQCPLRMHAQLDYTSSAVLLLDHHKRNFPTLQGHVTVSQQRTLNSLLLYQMTLSELDLLKSGPIVCFEVHGPTIPIAFKTINDLDTDPTGQFSVFSIRPHAVSVNPDWSIPVLLKYLTCISGFPCNTIKIGERELQRDVLNDLLQVEWFVVAGDSYRLPSNIATATA